MIKAIKTLILFVIPLVSSSQVIWELGFDGINSLSSPRAIDLNLDGVKDIVIGGGVEEDSSEFGFIAIDGETGALLWFAESRDQVFTSPVFLSINQDASPDVILGGRLAQLEAYCMTSAKSVLLKG